MPSAKPNGPLDQVLGVQEGRTAALRGLEAGGGGRVFARPAQGHLPAITGAQPSHRHALPATPDARTEAVRRERGAQEAVPELDAAGGT